MDDIIARIKHKLAYLQEHDDQELFEAVRTGELVSRYAVYTRHTENEIAAFEAQNQIRLPEDYRRFIQEIGSESAIPGMMNSPIRGMLTSEQASDFYERLAAQNVETDELWKKEAPTYRNLHRPFPSRLSLFFNVDLESVNPDEQFDGYLPIVYSGCQCWYVLITAGKAYGQIWYGDGSIYTPVMQRKGKFFDADSAPLLALFAQRATFGVWFEAQLDKQIRFAQEHWQKRGHAVPPLTLSEE